jgi:heat shock protein HslJ
MRCAAVVTCCLLCALLSACGAGRLVAEGKTTELSLDDLAGRSYSLVSMDGRSFEGGDAPQLRFGADGRVSGSACNRFSGTAKIVNGMLTAKNAASTRMACFQPYLNELEQTLSDMLQNGARVSLDSRRLTLTRDGHSLVYALPPPPS